MHAAYDPTDLLFEAKRQGHTERLGSHLARGEMEETHATLLDMQGLAPGDVLASIRLVDGDGKLVDHVGKVISLRSAAFVIEAGADWQCLLVVMVARRPANPTTARLAWMGVEGAGKTSFLHRVKFGEFDSFKPTVGIELQVIDFEGHDIENIEVSGYPGTRDRLARKVLAEVRPDCMVFVIDGADPTRLAEAREYLEACTAPRTAAGAPVLVLVTKLDVPGAFSPAEIAAGLELEKLMDATGRQWRLVGVNARTGTGIDDFLYNVARLTVLGSRLGD